MLRLSARMEKIDPQSRRIEAKRLKPARLLARNADRSVTVLVKSTLTPLGSVATNSRSWLGRSSQYDLLSEIWFVSGRLYTSEDP